MYDRSRSLNDILILDYNDSLPSPSPKLSSSSVLGVVQPFFYATMCAIFHSTTYKTNHAETPRIPPHTTLRHRLVWSHLIIPQDDPDRLPMSPSLPMNMFLISKYFPWRIHMSPNSVRDFVMSLYTVLLMRVTDQEMNVARGKYVTKAYAKRVGGAGEEKEKKGVSQADFLLGCMKFVQIEPADEPIRSFLTFLNNGALTFEIPNKDELLVKLDEEYQEASETEFPVSFAHRYPRRQVFPGRYVTTMAYARVETGY
ncbi:hypothetical protein EDD18DRAFT_1338605 [Armillaria luteobubalina]|uniref:DUF6699 domain-containing protein n=1 Tax=Armillaria luteobubalina TaxID=153913 RepID=A0AA39P299_9AGAR|nr:hypothetical protein EDD18DRAFT_1338605 [Armillaria luteobubalina]